jgi:phospholipid transport system substrate-binding protein
MNSLISKWVLWGPMLLSINIAWLPAVQATPVESPSEVLERSTRQVIDILENDLDLLRAEPDRVYKLVDDYVLPYLDEVTMAKLALGKNWRKASKQQKREFVAAFRDLLVRTYAKSLLEFSGQRFKFTPTFVSDDTVKTTVKAEVIQPGGPPVPLVYRMRVKSNTWKIYDIKVGGISLVTSYRGTFTQEVRKSGLDGLLTYMSSKKTKLAVSKENEVLTNLE